MYMCIDCCPCDCCCPECLKTGFKNRWLKIFYFFRRYFAEDTKYWFMVLFVREIIELVFQSFALLSYNGLNIFNPDGLVLSYPETSILIFSILLGINGIIAGSLWIAYVVNCKSYCRGVFFKYVVFVIDSLFDTFYGLFPIVAIIASQHKFRLSIAIGSLQTSNVYVFLCFSLFTVYVLL